jgi:hypothetical protein
VDTIRHRLSLRGNWKLNRATHMAAVTQIRFETSGRAYYDKKLTERKTKKEALRSLKRRVSITGPIPRAQKKCLT